MPAISANAPAKAILVGEHAVVYNQPAIAFPINTVHAQTTIFANPLGSPNEIQLIAADINLNANLASLPPNNPFVIALNGFMKVANISSFPACKIMLKSSIPIASGLGSSAATSISFIRALANFIGFPMDNQLISDLAFQVEVQYHGTPSGIDNTVIAHNQIIYFIKAQPYKIIHPVKPLTIVIANSGIKGNTKEAVRQVRQFWLTQKARAESIFLQIGEISRNAEASINQGDEILLGQLLNANHELLRQLNVSHPKLEDLIEQALQNGAYGAKLCGGGLGGNMIALVPSESAEKVADALTSAGATLTFIEVLKAGING